MPTTKTTVNVTKNIAKQTRFFTKNKNNNNEFPQLCSNEDNIIRIYLLKNTTDILNVH